MNGCVSYLLYAHSFHTVIFLTIYSTSIYLTAYRELDKSNGYQTTSVLCVPILLADNTVIGALEATNKIDGLFSSFDVYIATKLGATIGKCVCMSTAYLAVKKGIVISTHMSRISLQEWPFTTAGNSVSRT